MSELQGALAKPSELLDLRSEIEAAFRALRSEFPSKDSLVIRIVSVREPDPPLTDDKGALAVFTLRRLQALYHCATPDVVTTADVIIGYLAELQRALNELKPSVKDQVSQLVLDEFLRKASIAVQKVMLLSRNEPMRPIG